MSALGTTTRVVHTSNAVAVIDFVVAAAVTVATVRARRGLAAISGIGRRSVRTASGRLGKTPASEAAATGSSAAVEERGARIYHLPVRPGVSVPEDGPAATVIPLWG